MYQNASSASNKFQFPAFAMTGGVGGGTASGPGLCFPAGGNNSAAPWWRHFSTVELDQVRCPSFSGDVPSTYSNYVQYSSSGQINPPTNPVPSEPWQVVTTNYKAMTATHFACLQDPSGFTPNQAAEYPNGVIIPPLDLLQLKGGGVSIRQVVDGTSKTIVVVESKEQVFSSWYDGTASFVVAIPLGLSGSIYNTTYSTTAAIQPQKIMVAMLGTGIQTNYWRFPNFQTGVTGQHALNYGPKVDPNQVYNPPNAPSPHWTNLGGVWKQQGVGWQWGPSSDHSGGVVIHAWGDGHVSAITDQTDPTVYMWLVTRAGRESASDPAEQ